jgi:hypothetical protein
MIPATRVRDRDRRATRQPTGWKRGPLPNAFPHLPTELSPPLPPGVLYEQQQFAALMLEVAGYLDMSNNEKGALAAEIGAVMKTTD